MPASHRFTIENAFLTINTTSNETLQSFLWYNQWYIYFFYTLFPLFLYFSKNICVYPHNVRAWYWKPFTRCSRYDDGLWNRKLYFEKRKHSVSVLYLRNSSLVNGRAAIKAEILNPTSGQGLYRMMFCPTR